MNNNFEYMNDMESNLDPLDLAFLFLDGEANETEKQVLFEALSNDKNLQNDFQEAIEMKYAGIQEVKDLTPPAGLTNAVYSTIGIGAATTISNIANNVSSNYFSSLYNSVSTFISPISMIISSFIIGNLFSYFLIQNFDNNPNQNFQNNQSSQNNQNSQSNQKIIPITISAENITSTENNNDYNNEINTLKSKNDSGLVQVLRYKHNKQNPTIFEVDTLYYTQEKVKMLQEQQKSLEKSTNKSKNYKLDNSKIESYTIESYKIDSTNSYSIDLSNAYEIRTETINNGITTELNLGNSNFYNSHSNMPILTPNQDIDHKMKIITPIETNDKMNILPFGNSITTNKLDTLSNTLGNNITKSKIDPSNIKVTPIYPKNVSPNVSQNLPKQQNDIISNESQNYEFKLNSINTLNYFQDMYEKTNDNSSFNNLQATILYKISENQKVGFSIGNEDYPRFVKSGEEFIMTNNLTYYGGVYNYNFLDINFAGNIKSNINLLLGMSSNSLVNKSGIEINWKPDSKLSLNFGIESLLNAANYNNAYEYTGKMNIYYGISYNF